MMSCDAGPTLENGTISTDEPVEIIGSLLCHTGDHRGLYLIAEHGEVEFWVSNGHIQCPADDEYCRENTRSTR